MTLTEFLLARLAEDEKAARKISTWGVALDADINLEPWDSARVLAECEARRLIVEMWKALDAEARRTALTDPETAGNARMTRLGVEVALRLLALPFGDHPEYREEWRP